MEKRYTLLLVLYLNAVDSLTIKATTANVEEMESNSRNSDSRPHR